MGLTDRRHAGLATSQHQDNQDDDHNENDGADADIHVLSSSLEMLARAGVLDPTAQLGPD
jgi:hypothetical protein